MEWTLFFKSISKSCTKYEINNLNYAKAKIISFEERAFGVCSQNWRKIKLPN